MPEQPEAIVMDVISRQTGFEAQSIAVDSRLDDLGLESIDAIEMVIAVERLTGVRFDEADLEGIETVKDIVERLSVRLT